MIEKLFHLFNKYILGTSDLVGSMAKIIRRKRNRIRSFKLKGRNKNKKNYFINYYLDTFLVNALKEKSIKYFENTQTSRAFIFGWEFREDFPKRWGMS